MPPFVIVIIDHLFPCFEVLPEILESTVKSFKLSVALCMLHPCKDMPYSMITEESLELIRFTGITILAIAEDDPS